MTPRAWANALLLAGIFWASLIVALWLILAPKVGGVEAWHDSALPASAFVAIRSAGTEIATKSNPSPALHQPRTEAGFDKEPAGAAISKAPSVAALTGTASWYSYIPGQAAAGPALRVGDWRGRVVIACATSDKKRSASDNCVTVTLTDACQCLGTRLIDLDVRDFAKFADPSVGLLEVTISW